MYVKKWFKNVYLLCLLFLCTRERGDEKEEKEEKKERRKEED
jgi:hypothetical protein